MVQRKLTNDELEKVMAARHAIRMMCDEGDDHGPEYWFVYSRLRDMALHATNDGKPYVDPEPPIPDGYRKAVAGDEGRRDCKVLGVMGWHDRDSLRHGMAFKNGIHYIVPADRVPTDEDSKSRPEVMVRDSDDCGWRKRTLLAVFESHPLRFMCFADSRTAYAAWKHCRHLYPGE